MPITTSLAGNRDNSAAVFKRLFPTASPEDVARGAGAIDGSHVEFSGYGPNRLLVNVEHPQLSAFRIYSLHTARDGSQHLFIDHSSQKAHPSIRGNGTERFVEAVRYLKKLGVAGITITTASGSKGAGDNGYYSWPRMGFNGNLSAAQLESLSPELLAKMDKSGKSDLHTLFDLGGGEEWRERGNDLSHLHFDLRDGSEHLKRLEAYTNERRQRATDSGVRGVAGPSAPIPNVQSADSAVSNATNAGDQTGAGLDSRLTRALGNLRKQYEREHSADPVRYAKAGGFLRWISRKLFGGGKATSASPTVTTTTPLSSPSAVSLTREYTPVGDRLRPNVDKRSGSRDWAPKYPGFAVSPQQGLADEADTSKPFEPAPATSHLIGWRLAGGGFVKKFYGPAVDAPEGTNQVISVRFRDKKKGHSEYEYYFGSEDEADGWIARLRAAQHPGKVIWAMIRAEIPYKRKFQRSGETVIRYSKRYLQLTGGEKVEQFAADRPAHPLIQGFRLEHALRHLTTDPTATDSVQQLAAQALYEGDTTAVHVLHDALEENGHPLLKQYNWMEASHKIHVDDAVGKAIKDVAAHEEPVVLTGWNNEPELSAIGTLRFTHTARQAGPYESVQHPWPGHPAVAVAHEVLDRLDNHFSPQDIHDSLDRHHLRNVDNHWLSQGLGADYHTGVVKASLTPADREEHLINPQFVRAFRYKRDYVSNIVGQTYNTEINKIADRLHQQHGVADIDEFKQHDHFGRLLAANNYDHDIAADAATKLIYGGILERRSQPGQPLLPIVRHVGQFAGRESDRERQRQLGARTFTDAGLYDDSSRPEVEVGDRAPLDKLISPLSKRSAKGQQILGESRRANLERLKSMSRDELGQTLLSMLKRNTGGIPLWKVARDHLKLSQGRVRDAAAAANIRIEKRFTTGAQTHEVPTLFHPDETVEPQQHPKTQQYQALLAALSGGKSIKQLAAERGITPQGLGVQVRKAKQLFPNEKFRRAVEQVVRYGRTPDGFRWEDLNRWLGRRDSRNIDRNKTIFRDGGDIVTRLYRTEVVRAHPDGTFTLAHGGWNTPTTKRTISNFSPTNPFSYKGKLQIGGTEFFNGIRVDETGKALHEYPGADTTGLRDLLSDRYPNRPHIQAAVDYLRGRGPHPGPHPLSETQLSLLTAAEESRDKTPWYALADSFMESGHERAGVLVHSFMQADHRADRINGHYYHPEGTFVYGVRRTNDPNTHQLEVSIRHHNDSETGNSRFNTFTLEVPKHERPENYARSRAATDFLSALRRVRSQQQDTLRQLADAIHGKLKLKPTTIRDAIYDHVHVAATANTAQALYHGDPERARVAAAWYGLQTQTPSLLVFHVDDAGPETVHKISVNGSGERVRAALTKAGIHQRALLPTKTGWDCLVYDAPSVLGEQIKAVAAALGGSVGTSRGYGEIIGGSDGNDDARADAKSRSTYRKIISSWEREQQRGQQPVQQPLQPGTPVQFTGTIQPQQPRTTGAVQQ